MAIPTSSAAEGASGLVDDRIESGGESLEKRIANRIAAAGGRIPFAEYMSLCLYEPELGYYQRPSTKLGKAGDFYTSAHIGAVMGQCIARKLAGWMEERSRGGEPIAVVEWGGGDGRLAAAVLDELSLSHPEAYRRLRWLAAESSPHHRRLQREKLTKHHADRIEAIEPPEHERIDRALSSELCFVFANELLDALPVHRLRFSGGVWKELYVEIDPSTGAFAETEGPVSRPELERRAESVGIRFVDGQTVEIGLQALEWIRALGGRLRRGAALLIDYGDETNELWAPHRMRGTLLAYRDHRAGEQFYRFVGEQDITAHVNFEWCMEAAKEAGFHRAELRTQKQFLVEQGVLERLQRHDGTDPFSPAARTNRAIRQLLLSDGMSELFKVLSIEK